MSEALDDKPPFPSGPTTKAFQIHEPDLAELERILPILCDHALMFMTAPQMDGDTKRSHTLTRKQIEKVRDILMNVRWDYGPWLEVGVISA